MRLREEKARCRDESMKTRGWPDGDNIVEKSIAKCIGSALSKFYSDSAKTLAFPTADVSHHLPPSVQNSTDRRRQVFAVFSGHCFYCLGHISFSNFTIDHVRPRAKNGTNRRWNLVASCWPCNQKKGSRWPTDDEVGRARSAWIIFSESKKPCAPV